MDKAVCTPGSKPSRFVPTLMGLSNEILAQIFQILLSESTKDLYSFAASSQLLYGVFQSCKKFTFLSTLQQTTQPDILYHAIAAIKAPKITQRTPGRVVRNYLNDYFGRRITLSKDFEEILALYRFNARVSRFIQDYVGFSTGLLYADDLTQDNGDKASVTLSEAEIARFQRAFFRFEIYAICFGEKKVVRRDQIEWFLKNLTCWEVEELSCVHHYLCRRGAELFDRVEQEMVSFVLEASGQAHLDRDYTPPLFLDRQRALDIAAEEGLEVGDNNNIAAFEEYLIRRWTRRGGAHSPNPNDEPHSSETTPGGVRKEPRVLNFWHLGPLCKYRRDARGMFLSFLSKVIAHPLKHLECLLAVNGPCSRDQINLVKARGFQPFLDTAVDELCETTTEASQRIPRPNLDVGKTYNTANEGFRVAGLTHDYRRVLDDMHESNQFFILRLMGYVFWDADRLDQPVTQGKLSMAARKENWTDYYYELTGGRRGMRDRMRGRCADEMIGDIELPAEVRIEVLRRYGNLQMIDLPVNSKPELTEDELLERYVGL